MTPVFLVAAGLLAVAGGTKLRSESRRERALGVAECALGLACVLVPTPGLAAALAVTYGVFGGYLLYLRRVSPGASCGCFGVDERPVGRVHVALDLVAAAVAGVAAAFPPTGLVRYASEHPATAAPFAAGVGVTIYLAFLAVTLAPAFVRELRA